MFSFFVFFLIILSCGYYLSSLKINMMSLLQVPSCFCIFNFVFNRNFK